MPMLLRVFGFVRPEIRPTWVALFATATLGLTSCARSPSAEHDCAQAIEVVHRAQATSNDEWAWAALPGCGVAGTRAANGAWKALRSTADTFRIAQLYDRLADIRDSSLFETSRALLLDRAASAESRVFSAMLLVTQLIEHAAPDYQVYSTTGAHDVCTIGSVSDQSNRVGTPLPSDASERAQSTALRVLANESDPESVRNAARCMYEALRRDEPVYAQTPPWLGGGAHVTESAGRFDTTHVRPAADRRPHPRAVRRPRVRASADSVRRLVSLARSSGCMWHEGNRVHDGVLRKSVRGDVLETRDGRRLPVANLPRTLEQADGMPVWIAEPLGAPTSAGIIDPNHRVACEE